jgi:Fe2+ transport system protein B
MVVDTRYQTNKLICNLLPVSKHSSAKAHPGGVAILQKFNDKDATKAFHAAHHSAAAVEMLKDFAVVKQHQQHHEMVDATTHENNSDAHSIQSSVLTHSPSSTKTKIPRWKAKLFTKEDPIGVHKYLGVFVLLHFAFRFFQMLITDPSAGLGTRLGRGPSWIPVACLLPHGLLSLSSLIFHTVPKVRVVGKPMIWQ